MAPKPPTEHFPHARQGMVVTYRARTDRLRGKKWTPADLERMRAIVQNRAKALLPGGTRVGSAAPDRIVIQMYASPAPGALERVTARNELRFYILHQMGSPGQGRMPEWTLRRTDSGSQTLVDSRTGSAVSPAVLDRVVFSRPPDVTGADFAPEFRALLPTSGQPVVEFRLTRRAAARFEDVTRANIGKCLAAFLDKRLLVAPNISGPITGTGMLDNSFTPRQATDMAALLNAGVLAVPLVRVQSAR